VSERKRGKEGKREGGRESTGRGHELEMTVVIAAAIREGGREGGEGVLYIP